MKRRAQSCNVLADISDNLSSSQDEVTGKLLRRAEVAKVSSIQASPPLAWQFWNGGLSVGALDEP